MRRATGNVGNLQYYHHFCGCCQGSNQNITRNVVLSLLLMALAIFRRLSAFVVGARSCNTVVALLLFNSQECNSPHAQCIQSDPKGMVPG
jgi:hypothetical protein